MRQAALHQARLRLHDAGIECAALDARLLLQHVLRITHEDLICNPDAGMDERQAEHYRNLIDRRAAHEPVSRIVGVREFWGLEFFVTPDVLDPRADSETLTETALRYCPDTTTPLRILDLGTGSGCLVIALLHQYPNALGIGIDQSSAALAVAARDALHNNVAGRLAWHQGNWWQGWSAEPFDLIVSNPPYIKLSEKDALADDVSLYDPHSALFAGTDGLDDYRKILPGIKRNLNAGGICLLEIGFDQTDDVRLLAAQQNYTFVETVRDFGGNPRCVVLKTA